MALCRCLIFPIRTSRARPELRPTLRLQRLYFLNSEFVINQAKSLVSRLETMHPSGTEPRIRQVYRLLFQREPAPEEMQTGLKFLESGPDKWPQYAQALLSSTEYSS